MAHELAIIGPLPPPVAGVSLRLKNLLPFLDEEGIDYHVYNIASAASLPNRSSSVAEHRMRWFARYMLAAREPVVLLLTNRRSVWAGAWILAKLRRKRVIISVLGGRFPEQWRTSGRLKRWAYRRVFNAVDRIICAAKHSKEFIDGLGDFSHKTLWVPAYVPPVLRDGDEANLPEPIRQFAANHDPVLLATGGAVVTTGGVDMYGIDMSIELIDHLRHTYSKIGLLWFLLDVSNSAPGYADALRRDVEERGLQDHWLFCSPLDQFCPMYRLCDLLVRPTSFDGDASSIRESLHLQTPVVTSDAAPRPEHARVFVRRDQADYERAVRSVLSDLPAERDRLQNVENDCAVERLAKALKDAVDEALLQ